MSEEIITSPRDERAFHLTREPHHADGYSTPLGFWIYLMSDCLIFAILFATYAVLGHRYDTGPNPMAAFELKLVAVNTAILLVSSLTFGFAMLAIHAARKGQALMWMAVTGILGIAFLSVELHEFSSMIAEGHGPGRSAFLSAFFTLVGTHGLHVTAGIIWLVTLMIQVSRFGLTVPNVRRLECLSMFWHFLDLIWIGVFTFVYLVRMI